MFLNDFWVEAYPVVPHPGELIFIALLLVFPIILGLTIWVTVRGIRCARYPDRQITAVTGILLAWLVWGLGLIPGFLLTRVPQHEPQTQPQPQNAPHV